MRWAVPILSSDMLEGLLRHTSTVQRVVVLQENKGLGVSEGTGLGVVEGRTWERGLIGVAEGWTWDTG